ncbi:MAG: hypothetical protein ACI802_000116 [Candidatus Paceibacteria bacterium]|jgi:hypothetical protein
MSRCQCGKSELHDTACIELIALLGAERGIFFENQGGMFASDVAGAVRVLATVVGAPGAFAWAR